MYKGLGLHSDKNTVKLRKASFQTSWSVEKVYNSIIPSIIKV
jgi:hypothetical protein